MINSFIQLNRKIKTWQWYKNPNVFRVFIHCLLEANHKDNKFEGSIIKRGSLATSYDRIGEALNLSKQQVRTAIKKLKDTGELNTKPTSKYLLVSIIKYSDYQGKGARFNTQSTLNQHSNNTQITPNNNVNNVDNDTIINIEYAKEIILKDNKWLTAVQGNYNLAESQLIEKIHSFTLHATIQGHNNLTLLDYKKHFINWYKKSTGKGYGGKKILKYKKPTL